MAWDTPTNLAIYILSILGVAFVALGLWQYRQPHRQIAAKTYLRTGVIFLLVAAFNVFVFGT